MLNAAMIGLGWWGKELVRAARGSALLRFRRGVTLEPDTVRDFAAEMNINIGTSYEDVLADKAIDAVVLATPHTRHRAQVEAAAAAGKYVRATARRSKRPPPPASTCSARNRLR